MTNELRLQIEENYCKRLAMRLITRGYKVRIDNGGGAGKILKSVDEVMEAFRKTDDEYWYVSNVGTSGWVRLVFGNEPCDVVNDYTTNLEGVVGPIIETFAEVA